MEILRVDGLKFSYPNQLKKALNNTEKLFIRENAA